MSRFSQKYEGQIELSITDIGTTENITDEGQIELPITDEETTSESESPSKKIDRGYFQTLACGLFSSLPRSMKIRKNMAITESGSDAISKKEMSRFSQKYEGQIELSITDIGTTENITDEGQIELPITDQETASESESPSKKEISFVSRIPYITTTVVSPKVEEQKKASITTSGSEAPSKKIDRGYYQTLACGLFSSLPRSMKIRKNMAITESGSDAISKKAQVTRYWAGDIMVQRSTPNMQNNTIRDIRVILANIRVVLDKGYNLLPSISSNTLSDTLDKIAYLLLDVSSVIDPSFTPLFFSQEKYFRKKYVLYDPYLDLVTRAANEALDKILDDLVMKKKLQISRSKILRKLSDLQKELTIFKEKQTSGLDKQALQDKVTSFLRINEPLIELEHVSDATHAQGFSDRDMKLQQQLLGTGQHGIFMVPLLPVGGVANIDLAKVLYNDEKVKEHFDLRIWISISSSLETIKHDEKIVCAISEIMSNNVVTLGNHLPAVYSEEFKLWLERTDMGLQTEKIKRHQDIIRREVSGMKFLLVLNDVLEDQMSQWVDLFEPLHYGSLGSKVIVTSQSSEVIEALENVDIRNKEMEKYLNWKFLSIFALRKCSIEDHSELHDISKKIARRLRKFPLAGRMIGEILNKKRQVSFWQSMLDDIVSVCEKEKLKNEQYQLLSLISLCVNQLPAPLCWCFKYCSIFPSDWRFASETLVHLWMSQGFIDPDYCQHGQRPEDLGKEYFNTLFSLSFFNLVAANGTSYYVMHRFVHYLAEILSMGEFLRLEGTYEPRHAWGVLYLSVRTDCLSILGNIMGLHNVQTFITFGAFEHETSGNVENFLTKKHHLFVLDISGCGIKSFPEVYAPLRNLCYLNISDTGIVTLHDNITQLRNLLVLNIQGSLIRSLPEDMNKLFRLRHIIGPSSLVSTIRNIGALSDLQELNEFRVGDRQGYELSQLGSMDKLRGSLSITNLENVKILESQNAQLRKKIRLKSLKLEWCDPPENGELYSAGVLKGLNPPPSITELEISGYNGTESPSWLSGPDLLRLREIRLIGCMNWKELPFLGRLPYLMVLKIENMPSVTAVGPEHQLYFHHLRQLEFWDCPNLRELPDLVAPSLQDMHLERVGLKFLPLPTINPSEASWLTHIRIVDCPDLHYFSNTFRPHKVLKELLVENCPRFSAFTISVNEEDDASLPSSLMCLEITGCCISDDVFCKALIDLPSLSNLKVADCPNLTMFPSLDSLKFTTKFTHLHIDRCNMLSKLRGLEALSSLKELCILKCPQLIIEHASIEGHELGLLTLQKLSTDNISFLTGPLIEGLSSLRELRLKEIVNNNLLERIMTKAPFIRCLEKLALVNCANVTVFPKNFKEWGHLEQLYLENCPRMSSLPDLPSSLSELYITKCPLLEEACQEYSSVWYKINHIPYKFFD